MNNPYRPGVPGVLFTGRDKQLATLVDGLTTQKSYAIVGGRRMGKSSQLRALATRLGTDHRTKSWQVPDVVDLQSFDRVTVSELWTRLYAAIGGGVAPWSPAGDVRYSDFLRQMETANKAWMSQGQYEWMCILRVDELDNAAVRLGGDDTFFSNLRSFLMNPPWANHLRLVATGVTGLTHLIASGSPLNNLTRMDLQPLTRKDVGQLLNQGWKSDDAFDDDFLDDFCELTGRHPYLVQGIAEKLFGQPLRLVDARRGAKEFLRDHNVFRDWIGHFTPAAHKLYQLYHSRPRQRVSMTEAKAVLGPLRVDYDEALRLLSSHGVVHERDDDTAGMAGDLFAEWYQDWLPAPAPEGATPAAASQPAPLLPPASTPATALYVTVTQTQNNQQILELSQTDSDAALDLIAKMQAELATKLAPGSAQKARATRALSKIEETAKSGAKKSDMENALKEATGAFKEAGKTCDALMDYGKKASAAGTWLGELAAKTAQAMGWS